MGSGTYNSADKRRSTNGKLLGDRPNLDIPPKRPSFLCADKERGCRSDAISSSRIAAMTKINADAVEQVKKTAKENFGTDVTNNEAEQAIADYFDPTIPPPNIPQDQIDEIVESMWGDNSY